MFGLQLTSLLSIWKKLSFSLLALDKDYPTYWRNKVLPSMTLQLNTFSFLIKNLLVLKLIRTWSEMTIIIQMISKKGASGITAIKNIRNFVPHETFLTIYCALVQLYFWGNNIVIRVSPKSFRKQGSMSEVFFFFLNSGVKFYSCYLRHVDFVFNNVKEFTLRNIAKQNKLLKNNSWWSGMYWRLKCNLLL